MPRFLGWQIECGHWCHSLGYSIQKKEKQAWKGEVVEMMNSVWHMVNLEDPEAGVVLVEIDLGCRQRSWLDFRVVSRWVVKAKGWKLGQVAGKQ